MLYSRLLPACTIKGGNTGQRVGRRFHILYRENCAGAVRQMYLVKFSISCDTTNLDDLKRQRPQTRLCPTRQILEESIGYRSWL
jgi:hypothetical protein